MVPMLDQLRSELKAAVRAKPEKPREMVGFRWSELYESPFIQHLGYALRNCSACKLKKPPMPLP